MFTIEQLNAKKVPNVVVVYTYMLHTYITCNKCKYVLLFLGVKFVIVYSSSLYQL